MKATLLSLGFTAIILHAGAADFTRSASFDSVAAFIAADQTFQPATSESDFSVRFTVRKLGQPEDPKTGTPVATPTIESLPALWVSDAQAVVFVAASPPTEAMRSAFGALFLFAQERGSWRVVDILRFSATGNYAEASAKLTSDGRSPVITIKESHAGHSSSYEVSASYTLNGPKLTRLELE